MKSRRLAEAYNHTAGRQVLEITSNDFPINIYSPNKAFRVLYKFEGPVFWLMRLVMYPDQTPAMQFVRVESISGHTDYTNFRLTNDSINLVLFPEDFGLSLNQSISQAVTRNVVGDMPRARRSILELDSAAATLVRRIIEHQMLVAQANSNEAPSNNR